MSVSKVFSAAIDGIEAQLIEVETDIHVGLHSFSIVGLADKSLSEARERVSSALKNTKQLVVKIDNKNLSNTFIVDNVPIKTVLQVLNVLGERIHDEILFI